jgi:hypothetical protein
VKYAKALQRKHAAFIDAIARTYENSKFSGLQEGLRKVWGACIKNSFFLKLVGPSEPPMDMGDSRSARTVVRLTGSMYKNMVEATNESVFIGLLLFMNKDVKARPLRDAGIIVLVAVLTRLIISLFLMDDVGLPGWLFLYALALLAGVSISSNMDWERLKAGSYFIKLLNFN